MAPIKSIAVVSLWVGSTLGFQPLNRHISTSITRASCGSPLSVYKTERQQDVINTTDSTTDFFPTTFLKETTAIATSNGALLEPQQEEAVPEMSPIEGLLWKGSVVILCALWASNFPVAKLIMSEPGVDSSLYAVTRFSVAALSLAPFAVASTRRTGMDWETLKGATICGSWVAFGYLGQTLGLLTTTASKSCVICSLHCVFVAAIAEWLRVQKAQENMIQEAAYDFKRLVPAAIAVAGVAIVELKGGAGGANIGDALSFAQPIGFGLGYLILEDLMAKRPDTALAVSAIKLSVVALASLAMFEFTPLIKEGVDSFAFSLPDFSAIIASPVAMGGILYTGLVTTALALWFESIAFARVSAKDASLILTTEPLFAAALGAVALGETFGFSDYAGASMIIGACVLATLMDSESRDENCEPEDDDCEVPREFPFGKGKRS